MFVCVTESFAMDTDNDSFALSPPMQMRPPHRAQPQQPANTGFMSMFGFMSPTGGGANAEDVQLSDL